MYACLYFWYTYAHIDARHTKAQTQRPFEIKQIKENYWWPPNCLKTNDKTAASCEDVRLRDVPRGDWHLPHAHAATHSACTERIFALRRGGRGGFHVRDQSAELTEVSVFKPRFNCRLPSLSIHPRVFLLPLHQLICFSWLNFSS